MGSTNDHIGLKMLISDIRNSHNYSHEQPQTRECMSNQRTAEKPDVDSIFYLQQLCSELKHRYSPNAILSTSKPGEVFKLTDDECRLLHALETSPSHNIHESFSDESNNYPTVLYKVRFKRLIEVMKPSQVSAVYSLGDIVVADTKFGRNIGVIVDNTVGRSNPLVLDGDVPGNIIDLATPEEILSFQHKLSTERIALEDCREIIAKRGVEMDVLDAEYQLGGEKLAFFFTSKKWVNYRNLLASLHSRFQTRICMIKIADPELLHQCHVIRDLEELSSQHATDVSFLKNQRRFNPEDFVAIDPPHRVS